jgi:hypothetical protein
MPAQRFPGRNNIFEGFLRLGGAGDIKELNI